MVEMQVCVMHITPVPVSVDLNDNFGQLYALMGITYLSRLKRIFVDISPIPKERNWGGQHP